MNDPSASLRACPGLDPGAGAALDACRRLLARAGYCEQPLPAVTPRAWWTGPDAPVPREELALLSDRADRALALAPELRRGLVEWCVAAAGARRRPQRRFAVGPVARYRTGDLSRLATSTHLAAQVLGAAGLPPLLEALELARDCLRQFGVAAPTLFVVSGDLRAAVEAAEEGAPASAPPAGTAAAAPRPTGAGTPGSAAFDALSDEQRRALIGGLMAPFAGAFFGRRRPEEMIEHLLRRWQRPAPGAAGAAALADLMNCRGAWHDVRPALAAAVSSEFRVSGSECEDPHASPGNAPLATRHSPPALRGAGALAPLDALAAALGELGWPRERLCFDGGLDAARLRPGEWAFVLDDGSGPPPVAPTDRGGAPPARARGLAWGGSDARRCDAEGRALPVAGFELALDAALDAVPADGAPANTRAAPVDGTPARLLVVPVTPADAVGAARLARDWRAAGLHAELEVMGRSIKRVLQHAPAAGYDALALIGADERAAGCVTVRDLRRRRQQPFAAAQPAAVAAWLAGEHGGA